MQGVLLSWDQSKEKKGLLLCNCNPDKTLINHCLEFIIKEIDSYSTRYDNIPILENFKSKPTEGAVTTFCQIHNLKILINERTCYKNPNNTTCIDLIMRNRLSKLSKLDFVWNHTIRFHKMTLTVLKVSLMA